ncbi:MAG TPA: S-layer homology domain-containing protein [Thermoanaerobaculia bacterium]|nr:S-layer homology domain-containing protein [Thermoanaerobaculia bacterium]
MPGFRGFMSLLLCFAGAVALTAASLSAQSIFDEAMAGAYGRPEIQFVQIRFSSCRENQWAGTRRLAFFDATGAEVGELVVPTNPTADCRLGWHLVLFGTQAFADLPSTPEPDFLIPPLMVPGSGMVCFESIPAGTVNQCLSYGNFTGAPQQGSAANADGLSGLGTCSLQRIAFFEDFGNINFNQDFVPGEPTPRNSVGETGVVVVPPRFSDVPAASPFRRFVEALFNSGISGGCGNGAFCPTALVTREQMAVLLLRAAQGAAFQPSACGAPIFNDVPCSNPFAPWINELAVRGISGGCGGGSYCPGGPVTREQMAVFLLLAAEGSGFSPPACASPAFADVPCSSPFAPWVNELAARGITGGCGGGNFCPQGSVTREQMAVFLSTAFSLPVPTGGCADVPEPADDHGNTLGTATAISLGQAATPGAIERPGDVDVFSIPVVVGEPIFIETLGDDLRMSSTLVILDGNGTELTSGSHGEIEATTRAFLEAPSSPLFAQVNHGRGGTGSYGIRARPVVDDHGDIAANATALTPGVPVIGEWTTGDVDFFSFQPPAGQIFVVEIQGLFNATDLTFLLLGPGPSLFRDGESIFAIEAQYFTLNNPPTGTYFIQVHGFSSLHLQGAYRITLRGPIVDDHGNTLAQATPLTPDARVAGAHEFEGDADLFSFQAAAGEAYRMSVAPTGPGSDPEVSGLAPNGTPSPLVHVPQNDLVPVAGETGLHFARVSQTSLDRIGPYELNVTGPLSDDHGNIAAAATPFTPGDPAVAAELDFENDRDFFSFPAQMGETVLLEAATDDRLLLTVFGLDGTTVLDWAGSSSTFNAWIQFTAPADGTYFARVSGFFWDSTGPYELSIQTVPDDHGNLPATAAGMP